MKKREIVVADMWKSRTSPTAELVDFACGFSSRLMISSGNMQANMKSMMGMAVLNLTPGMAVEVTAEGGDEEKALDAVEAFLSGNTK